MTISTTVTTLMTDAGPVAPDTLVTRTGGLPLAPAGTSWPRCASCEGPLRFLAQIVLDDLVLALFACQNDPGMCDDWDPESGGNRALLFPCDGLRPLPEPDDEAEEPFTLGAVRAVALERKPGGDYDQAREAHSGTAVLGQLGGRPAWIQGDETPACPSCARAMPFVTQLEEGPDHRTSMNFGGGGCAYAFTCEPCGEARVLWPG
jgi:hypothetical protein